MKKRARQRKVPRTAEEHCFCVVVRAELLSDACCLILPVPENYLTSTSGGGGGGALVLETRNGGEWEIEFEAGHNSNTIRLGAKGWHAFRADNRLSLGDSIVFTLLANKFMRFSAVVFGRDGVEKEALPRPPLPMPVPAIDTPSGEQQRQPELIDGSFLTDHRE